MTQLHTRLSAMKERIAKATSADKWKDAGEWFHDHRVGYPLHGNGENDDEDCEFIAHSRTDIELLIAALERAMKALECSNKLRSAFGDWLIICGSCPQCEALVEINRMFSDGEGK